MFAGDARVVVHPPQPFVVARSIIGTTCASSRATASAGRAISRSPSRSFGGNKTLTTALLEPLGADKLRHVLKDFDALFAVANDDERSRLLKLLVKQRIVFRGTDAEVTMERFSAVNLSATSSNFRAFWLRRRVSNGFFFNDCECFAHAATTLRTLHANPK